MLLQLLTKVNDLTAAAGKVTAEAVEEPVAMSRGEKEGTTTCCILLQRLEKEILAYQPLLGAAEEEPATAGNRYNVQSRYYSGSRNAQPNSCDSRRNFKTIYKKKMRGGE